MEQKIKNLLNLDGLAPKVVLMSGSIDNAKKWCELIIFLADWAQENAETGYRTLPLIDELGILCWQTFDTLDKMGVTIPNAFPEELIHAMKVVSDDSDSDAYEEFEAAWAVIEKNPYSSLIYEMFKCLNDVFGFYTAYIYPLVLHSDNDDIMDLDGEIEACLLNLAATKLESEHVAIASNFGKFRTQAHKDYEKWLNELKLQFFHHNIPLKAELLDLVYESSDSLSVDAENESLGFNQSQLHPDIYMNELLTGMRLIHQVLPVIMKKLDIYDDFKVDESGLRLSEYREK